MTINNGIIKVLEQYDLGSKMPVDLKAYLFNRYSSEPLPYEYSEQDLYAHIKQDINAYQCGELDLVIKTPEELLRNDLESVLDAYGDALVENKQQVEEIHLLQDFIQYHKLKDLFEIYKKDPQPVTWDDELRF